MLRPSSIACVLGALLLAACSKSPVSPSEAGAVPTGRSEAKPGPVTPTPSAHMLSFGPSIFGDPGYDGYPSPGYVSASPQSVQGWITGSSAADFKASAAGTYTMTITDVDELPDDASGGDPCTEPEQDYLRSLGLVAASVTGSLTLTIDQDTTGSVQGPKLAWELGNIQVLSQPGYTWKILGASGSTNPLFKPVFDPSSTNTNLTVNVENGRAHYYRYPNVNSKKQPSADQFIACRTDLTMVMTKQ
jgi:hypothetical protein